MFPNPIDKHDVERGELIERAHRGERGRRGGEVDRGEVVEDHTRDHRRNARTASSLMPAALS
jgi:hypothetical protein